MAGTTPQRRHIRGRDWYTSHCPRGLRYGQLGMALILRAVCSIATASGKGRPVLALNRVRSRSLAITGPQECWHLPLHAIFGTAA